MGGRKLPCQKPAKFIQPFWQTCERHRHQAIAHSPCQHRVAWVKNIWPMNRVAIIPTDVFWGYLNQPKNKAPDILGYVMWTHMALFYSTLMPFSSFLPFVQK